MKTHEQDGIHRWASYLASAAVAFAATGCGLYYGDPEEFKEEEKLSCLEELHNTPSFSESFPLEFGPTVKSEDPLPPVSGGSLALAPDQTFVVAADSDRDRVYIVSLGAEPSLLATVTLEPQDEPGRVVIDDMGRAHVALRRGDKVVSIDTNDGTVLGRHTACAAPRGIDFDEVTGLLYVACHSGKLVTMDPASGQLQSETTLDQGLRDVVVTDDHIYISKFRSADLIVLDRDYALVTVMRPPGIDSTGFDELTGEEVVSRFEAAVAWRLLKNPAGGVVMIHQRAKQDAVKPTGGGYGGDFCTGGIVHSAVTPMRVGVEPPATSALNMLVLPVDATLIDSGQTAVVVAAGNGATEEAFMPSLMDVPVNTVHQDFDCFFGDGDWELWQGQAIAAVSTTNTTVVVQMRDPAQLRIFPNGQRFSPITLELNAMSRRDTGHSVFHANTGAGLSCASCHPEGRDDGQTWEFECIGPRRTQSLTFGLLGTEPFHWDGDMNDLDTLMNEVFVGRMGGTRPDSQQLQVMGEWLDTVRPPTVSVPEDQAAVTRGEVLFNNPAVGCATCHSGPKLMTQGWYDVGTGGRFQVPSLIGLADRGPYIHTGCAKTLRERFTKPDCGGGDQHGQVSTLTPQQLDDLLAYLNTL